MAVVGGSTRFLTVGQADMASWSVKLHTVGALQGAQDVDSHRQVVGDVGGVRNVLMGGSCPSNNWGVRDQSTGNGERGGDILLFVWQLSGIGEVCKYGLQVQG